LAAHPLCSSGAYPTIGPLFSDDHTTARLAIVPPEEGCIPTRYEVHYQPVTPGSSMTTILAAADPFPATTNVLLTGLRPESEYTATTRGMCNETAFTRLSLTADFKTLDA
jgi:hypothetical protein